MQNKAVKSPLSMDLTAFYRRNLHIFQKIPQNMHVHKSEYAYFGDFC